VQVSALATPPVGTRLALEFREPYFIQDVAERGFVNLQLPDDIAECRSEICVDLV
jgi:hypothetical protein